MKEKIIDIMSSYIRNMEGYSYYGERLGIPEDDIEEIAEKIIRAIYERKTKTE